MSKLKITGFGRFVIFLIIALPIAYFGSQYLQNSGTLDKMKEKLEGNQEAPLPEAKSETGEDILSQINTDRKSQADREAEAIIVEQQRKIDELRRQNEELRKSDPVQPSTINVPPPPPPVLVPTSPPTTNQRGGLDDLIQTAEDNMRKKGNNPNTGSEAPSTTSSDNSKSLATWAFSFSGTNGTIELFQQGQKLIARTSYAGRSKVDVQELVEQNNRLYVKGSPTNEYYTLKSNGDLDAYDETGFLTTCRKR